ncbi:WD repeat-containing protein on Y chromosome-like isoform X2 [Hylaeus anthracinus]|uniref:WD repeat-containing protein on Y chromosome-like isoform X2 n=1 Tax=Hylaeus anthracinus TaxID=313031 RepID=UPI0023B994CC|nr:WD repeat-containing protein on Y chromosome-like isoform X2 [Hylaeus anthracinus]
MENADVIEEKDLALADSNESDSSDNETTFIYGKSLRPPILGSFYRVPDISKKYIEPTILDTSLSYIPVYEHLKMYDLKPVERPNTPPTLSELRSKVLEDNESCLSSKAPLTGRTSIQRSSITMKSQDSERVLTRCTE